MKKCNCGACDAGGAVAAESSACGCGKEHREEHEHNGQLSSARQDLLAVLFAAAVAAGALLLTGGALQSWLLSAAVLIAGYPIFIEGIKGILRLDLEEMALMTIAVIAACIIGEQFEGLMVTLLFRIGQLLEDVAVTRSRREVEAVTRIIPENATLLLEDGTARVVEAKTLEPGSRILVKSGERLPADAVVVSGSSSVDTSSLTGESVAREVYPGDNVLSGAINLGGVLTCETTSSFQDSTASKIIGMVRESAAKKGGTERLISRFARVYTPIVIAAALVVAFVPPLLGLGELRDWVSRALVFLVASCPCAMVISVPLAFFAGVGGASKQGILIKGSKYMEVLARARAVVFDKTGTLTTGALQVEEVSAVPGVSKEEVLRLAAVCESYSNHPIAKAVTAAFGVPDQSGVESCREITSYGMEAVVDGQRLLCGSARFLEREGLDPGALPTADNVFMARDGEVIGSILVFDNPRPEAAEAVRQLAELGITQTAMLTGDGEAAARKVQEMTGIGRAEAGLLPADKVERFREIRSGCGGAALFVGDGINDSPVLAGADAGVAMGLAADAAMEAADVVLLSHKLTSLPQAIRISRRTVGIARFNIAFAMLVKLVVLALAVASLASMWMAVFADVGVTVLLVLNATRALRFR